MTDAASNGDPAMAPRAGSARGRDSGSEPRAASLRSWRSARQAIAGFLAAIALSAAFSASASEATAYAATGTVELAFTPGDAADAMIVGAIAGAEREVLVLAYAFTHPRIARALTAANRRGVRVEVVADRGQTFELPQSAVPALARDGVGVWLDGNFGAAHNKVVIIDADGPHPTTITGSYNFTLAAQKKNAENVVMLRDNAGVALAYRAYFRRLQAKAQRWDGEGASPKAKSRARASPVTAR